MNITYYIIKIKSYNQTFFSKNRLSLNDLFFSLHRIGHLNFLCGCYKVFSIVLIPEPWVVANGVRVTPSRVPMIITVIIKTVMLYFKNHYITINKSDVNCFDLRVVFADDLKHRIIIYQFVFQNHQTFKELFVYDHNNYCEKKVELNVNDIMLKKKSTVGKRFKCDFAA